MVSRELRPYAQYRPLPFDWPKRLPTGWDVRRFKFCASAINAKVADSEQSFYVALENVESLTGNLFPGDVNVEPESLVNRFAVNDVLFGKLRPYLAKTWRAERAGVCSTEFLVLRGKAYIPEFLRWLCLSQGFVAKVNGSTFGSKMPRASWSDIGEIASPLPPPDEQRLIAAFLNRETAYIDKLTENRRKQIERLREKRAATITQAVTRGLNSAVGFKDSGVPWLGKIPAHWEIKRLRYLGEAIIGLTYDPADVAGPDDGTLVLRASNVAGGRLVLDDCVYVKARIPPRLVTRVDDILICARSGSRALIGKSASIDSTAAGHSFGTFMLVFRGPHNKFLRHVFASNLFEYQAGAFLTTTINQLTKESLSNFFVALPPAKEKLEIAEWLGRRKKWPRKSEQRYKWKLWV